MKQEELSHKRRKQMAESLKKLMMHKNLQKITIQEIADDCGISRYTFYYHFKDIYDLLIWTFQDEALSLIQKSDNCLTWQDGFQLFLRSLRDDKAVWQCAMNSLGQDALRSMLYQEISHLMHLFLNDMKGRYQVSEEYLTFLGDFYISALSGVLMEWLRRDADLSEETIMKYLHVTMEGQIEAAFARAQNEV